METQRQWSDLAIARTTPALLGLFSSLCWLAYPLNQGTQILAKGSAWYLKTEATFADILARVRRVIWTEKYFNNSSGDGSSIVIQRHDWECLIDQLVEAT